MKKNSIKISVCLLSFVAGSSMTLGSESYPTSCEILGQSLIDAGHQTLSERLAESWNNFVNRSYHNRRHQRVQARAANEVQRIYYQLGVFSWILGKRYAKNQDLLAEYEKYERILTDYSEKNSEYWWLEKQVTLAKFQEVFTEATSIWAQEHRIEVLCVDCAAWALRLRSLHKEIQKYNQSLHGALSQSSSSSVLIARSSNGGGYGLSFIGITVAGKNLAEKVGILKNELKDESNRIISTLTSSKSQIIFATILMTFSEFYLAYTEKYLNNIGTPYDEDGYPIRAEVNIGFGSVPSNHFLGMEKVFTTLLSDGEPNLNQLTNLEETGDGVHAH